MEIERFIKTHLWTTDEELIRYLAQAMIFKGKSPALRPSSVQERARLPEIPKALARTWAIQKEIGDFEQLGIYLDNRTLDTQVKSLLADVDDKYRKELVHFFKRIIVGELSRDLKWAINQHDLDHVSASMFIIHLLGILVDSRVNWIKALRGGKTGASRTQSGRTIPRPDSALINSVPEFIQQAQDSINVVSFEPLRRLCSLFFQRNTIQSLGQNTISSLLNIPLDTARNRVSVFNLALTERFIPHYSAMGLRQRWIRSRISPDERYRPSPESLGLIGKFLIGFDNPTPTTLHLEPINSVGPHKIPGIDSFTTDFESVSLRLDRYNIEEEKWDFDVWKEPERWTRKSNLWNPQKKLWLRRRTDTKKKILRITSKQMRLIGALAANQGSVRYRRLLLRLLGIKLSSIKARIDRLCDIGALSVLYHPLLEYSGLPEAIMLQVPDISGDRRDNLMHWISGVMPYSHIYCGKRDSLVAIFRIPKNQTDITISFVNEYLSEGPLGLPIVKFDINPIINMSTYNISIAHRMIGSGSNRWKDPWFIR